jgi:hypothetical protein
MAVMTEEWVSFWYQCLSQNLDYSRYCKARRANDTAQCQGFEARFDRIKEIYDDFGELDGWGDTTIESPEWKAWFDPRKHLFTAGSPREIAAPHQYVARPGYLLLEIPLQKSAEDTCSSIEAYLAAHYSDHSVVPVPKPKYVLKTVDGRPAHGYEQVRQACLSAARSYRYDLQTFEELRHVDAVAAFVRHEIDNFGWKIDPKARKKLLETGELSEQNLESYKAMLNKCRRDFRAFAANTIRGSFPDATPFASDVLDMF